MPRITKELIAKQTLLFAPKTAMEVSAIQYALFDLGVKWSHGVQDPQEERMIARCIRDGMCVIDGMLYKYPSAHTKAKAIRCTFDDLGIEDPYRIVAKLTAKFNDLSEKFDKQTALLEKIYAELHPELNKQVIKRGERQP